MVKGRMEALAFLRLRLFGVAGVGKFALPWGRMYALLSLVRGKYGTMCIAKVWDVRPRIPWALLILLGRYGTMCIAKWSNVRPRVFLGLHIFYVTGEGRMCLVTASGSFMYPRTNTVRNSRRNPLTYSLNPFFNASITFSSWQHSLTVLKHTHINPRTHIHCPPITFVLPFPFVLSLKLYWYRFTFADPSRRTRTTKGLTKDSPGVPGQAAEAFRRPVGRTVPHWMARNKVPQTMVDTWLIPVTDETCHVLW